MIIETVCSLNAHKLKFVHTTQFEQNKSSINPFNFFFQYISMMHDKAIGMLNGGMSQQCVAAAWGVHLLTISCLRREIIAQGSTNDHPLHPDDVSPLQDMIVTLIFSTFVMTFDKQHALQHIPGLHQNKFRKSKIFIQCIFLEYKGSCRVDKMMFAFEISVSV